MKKLIFTLFAFLPFFVLTQSKYTLEEAQKTNDPKVLANFIINNPNHPKVQDLKQRLAFLTTSNTKSKTQASTPISTSKTKHHQTADILNHILGDNTNSSQAYVIIKNASVCDIVLQLQGKQNYTIKIPAKKEERTLIEKGHYTLTSKICRANYLEKKFINSAIQMTLNNAK